MKRIKRDNSDKSETPPLYTAIVYQLPILAYLKWQGQPHTAGRLSSSGTPSGVYREGETQ